MALVPADGEVIDVAPLDGGHVILARETLGDVGVWRLDHDELVRVGSIALEVGQHVTGLAAGRGFLVAVGSTEQRGRGVGMTWRSTDGRSWRGTVQRRLGPLGDVVGGRELVAVGADRPGAGGRPAYLRSTDGRRWTSTPLSFSAGVAETLSKGPGGYVATATMADGRRLAWAGGERGASRELGWNLLALPPELGLPREGYALSATTVLAAGDGRIWHRLEDGAWAPAGPEGERLVGAGDLVLVDGPDGSAWSPDGTTWTPLPGDGSWRSTLDAAAGGADGSLLVVGHGDAGLVAWTGTPAQSVAVEGDPIELAIERWLTPDAQDRFVGPPTDAYPGLQMSFRYLNIQWGLPQTSSGLIPEKRWPAFIRDGQGEWWFHGVLLGVEAIDGLPVVYLGMEDRLRRHFTVAFRMSPPASRQPELLFHGIQRVTGLRTMAGSPAVGWTAQYEGSKAWVTPSRALDWLGDATGEIVGIAIYGGRVRDPAKVPAAGRALTRMVNPQIQVANALVLWSLPMANLPKAWDAEPRPPILEPVINRRLTSVDVTEVPLVVNALARRPGRCRYIQTPTIGYTDCPPICRKDRSCSPIH